MAGKIVKTREHLKRKGQGMRGGGEYAIKIMAGNEKKNNANEQEGSPRIEMQQVRYNSSK